jgi:hypothetical protein
MKNRIFQLARNLLVLGRLQESVRSLSKPASYAQAVEPWRGAAAGQGFALNSNQARRSRCDPRCTIGIRPALALLFSPKDGESYGRGTRCGIA